jgi:hypothetical protein
MDVKKFKDYLLKEISGSNENKIYVNLWLKKVNNGAFILEEQNYVCQR